MVIKTDKINIIMSMLYSLFIIFAGMGICIVEEDIFVGLLILVCGLTMLVLLVFPIIRVIVMKKDGCTVSWLLWKKTYSWNEFKVIREDYLEGRLSYEGVFFSVKPLKAKGKKNVVYQITESVDFLKDFYVLYSSNKKDFFLKREYIVEQEAFLRQLKEWGIKVEIGDDIRLLRNKRRKQEEWNQKHGRGKSFWDYF